MARKNMPTASTAINSVDGKTSYLLVISRRNPFPATGLGIVSPVSDLNSTLTFTASLVKNTNKRAHIKLVAVNPVAVAAGGAVTPADGVLSITLVDTNTGDTLPVTETPVDYVED